MEDGELKGWRCWRRGVNHPRDHRGEGLSKAGLLHVGKEEGKVKGMEVVEVYTRIRGLGIKRVNMD